ncbi:uncharacterized protein LOC125767227 [Anopheles funestus]|uniref:uncharacterized protein LOC125767227 n=1 Tax=Anopheles funestus TaxID=62324 RepID=UPI0020C67560|nr:uncharacterized protein LOC125767227 [Anopheles funestus]XP_049289540.1 uncharacterized protein LOC125767227 [Anopheles funestus]XP_049289541.1 uncharacterized protein LOC125767227 [Anopheles funestus]XP_049289542.1 uncharacterized protein LOC125767227 [Anopheles funestus]
MEKFLIEIMPLQSINAKDELFEWSALDYAFAINYDITTNDLLTAGAAVNRDTLFQQIISNHLNILLIDAFNYGEWLHSRENTKMIANQLHIQLVEYLLNEKHLDVFSLLEELRTLTILEFCTRINLVSIVKLLMNQTEHQRNSSSDQSNRLFQIALENKAHDTLLYFIDECNMVLPKVNNTAELIAALKFTFSKNHMNTFKIIFHQLCYQLNIIVIEDVEIVEDIHGPSNNNIPSLDKDDYPKVCCVRSSNNVRISLPEYDEKDILHEGYLVEALLARAVHEGNIQIVKYIVQKTNMVITNRLIVMVMRLLPKDDEVCHEKSMSAFIYLLDKTTDQNTTDDEGRSLLHMTAQNGCFFMLRCMIAKGFDPAEVNTRNGWNVFHYVAFNQDEDRSTKILEFLLKFCGIDWFHVRNIQ